MSLSALFSLSAVLAFFQLSPDSVTVTLPTGGTSPFIGYAIGAAAVALTGVVTRPFKGADNKVGAFIRPAQPLIALALPGLARHVPIIGDALASVPPDVFTSAPVGTLVGIAALEGLKRLFGKRPG